MSMPLQTTDWTVDMLADLPDDGNRYEIIGGELYVTPTPRYPHQLAASELFVLMHNYLREHGIAARVLLAPADVRHGRRTSVEPDLFVLRKPAPLNADGWAELPTLLLAVEVLSPSTARVDRQVKRRLYQSAGVEYWIVDIDGRVVERWLPADTRPDVIGGTLHWSVDDSHEPLVIDLDALFDEATNL